jgi:hypothetical protein
MASINVNPVFARCEFDTHADTCALGCNFVPLSFTGRVCDVTPYNADSTNCEKNIPIITGATAYTCPMSGQTFILVVNEGLWFGSKLSHSLLNQNQLRYNALTVNDNPFDRDTPLSIEHPELTIPLHLEGTNIFLDSRTPTQHELDTSPHIHLTSDAEWNPQTIRLAAVHPVEAEENMAFNDTEPGLSEISCVYSFSAMAASLHDLYGFHSTRSIRATNVDLPGHKTFISKDRHSAVTPEQLSERWNIGLAQAKQTILVTTQRGIRSAILPLSRRY